MDATVITVFFASGKTMEIKVRYGEQPSTMAELYQFIGYEAVKADKQHDGQRQCKSHLWQDQRKAGVEYVHPAVKDKQRNQGYLYRNHDAESKKSINPARKLKPDLEIANPAVALRNTMRTMETAVILKLLHMYPRIFPSENILM